MYRKKDKSQQSQMQMICIEDLVPQDHMLREIEEAIDWTFIAAFIKPNQYEVSKTRKFRKDIFRVENLVYDEASDSFFARTESI